MNNYDTSQNQPAGSGFFNSLRNSGWFRAEPAVFGGVCAGISYKTGWDRNLVRFIFILLSLFLGGGVFLYGLAWLLLPHGRDGSIVLEQAAHGNLTGGLFLSGLMILFGFSGFSSGISSSVFGLHGLGFTLFLLPIALVAGLLYLIFQNSSSNKPQSPYQGDTMPNGNQGQNPPNDNTQQFIVTPDGPQPEGEGTHPNDFPAQNSFQPQGGYAPQQPPVTASTSPYEQAPIKPKPKRPAPSKRFSLITLALMLLSIPVAYLFANMGWFPTSSHPRFTDSIFFGLTVLAISSIVLAIALLVNAIQGRRSSWFAGIGVALIVLLVHAVPVGIMGLMPNNISSANGIEIEDDQINLVQDIADEKPLHYNFGIGDLEVLLPEDVPTTVQINVKTGQIDLSQLRNYHVVDKGGLINSLNNRREFSGVKLTLFISNVKDWRNAAVQASIDVTIGDVNLNEISDDYIKNMPRFTKQPASPTLEPNAPTEESPEPEKSPEFSSK